EEGAAAVELDGEKKVAVAVGELRVDEGAGLASECVPSHGLDEGGGQQAAEDAGGVLGRFEGRFEEGIVRLLGHRGATVARPFKVAIHGLALMSLEDMSCGNRFRLVRRAYGRDDAEGSKTSSMFW